MRSEEEWIIEKIDTEIKDDQNYCMGKKIRKVFEPLISTKLQQKNIIPDLQIKVPHQKLHFTIHIYLTHFQNFYFFE